MGVNVVGEQGKFRAGDGQAEFDEIFEVRAAQLGADEDEELFFGFNGVAEVRECVGVGSCARGCSVVSGEVARKRVVAEWREVEECLCLTAELDLFGVGDVEPGAIEADVGAQVPGSAGGLICGIAAYKEDGWGGLGIAQGGGAAFGSGEGLGEGYVVCCAMVVDVVGAEDRAGELLEEVGLFVGDAVGADDADALAAALIAEFAERFADVVKGLLPGDGLEFAVRLANEGLGDAVGVVGEVEGVAAFVAEEVAVDA